MRTQTPHTLSGTALKGIALAAMTGDHLAAVFYPGYARSGAALALHILGRIAAPIFFYLAAEGFYHTRSVGGYLLRLLGFSALSHFAYNFAFGIPFVPFQESVFNQTSVMWPIFLGVAGLWVLERTAWPHWKKVLSILALTAAAFPADWSSIGVLAILEVGTHRGDFRRQGERMMKWMALYALVYAVFLDRLYGLLQLCTVLSLPLLRRYSGRRGPGGRGLQYFFYLYYPAHLLLCGWLRLRM